MISAQMPLDRSTDSTPNQFSFYKINKYVNSKQDEINRPLVDTLSLQYTV